MHLKRLDIIGFKSFADTIKLDFEPGITAIVGPNGCGKSNIIDAVRWCLGEMSAKSLRSSLMLDVVFNGSGSRPPQNMAEVTLTFDNTDKRLPIDFSDVSVSRRLFRSGESEYFINKTQCRLRDIKELFLDTGMGEDGYSSLEQGKVEWILQAKPEERRELFEEAAGVSKYRARREEALRKMERVEIDLSRLADIIAVTQEQIRKLENAVNKAKTYQRVREELKNMEVNDWLFQLSNAGMELTEIHARLEEAQKTAEELNTQLHQRNTEVSEHRLELTRLEEELLNANNTLNGIDSNVKIGEERLNNARRREQELEAQKIQTQESISREEIRIRELEEQKAIQTQALQELKSTGEKIEADFSEYQALFNQRLADLEAKRNKVKESRDQILEKAQERARLQQQMGHLTSDAARLGNQAENIQKERDRAQTQLNEIQINIDAAESQVSELKSQLAFKSGSQDEMTSHTQQLAAKEQDVRGEILKQTEEIAKLKGQIESIKDQQVHDPYLAGAQAALSSGLPGVYGPVGRLFQTDPANRDVVAATIGEHLGDLVADTTEDAERVIEFLNANEKGRVRIWILKILAQSPSSGFVGSLSQGNSLSTFIQTDDIFKPLLNHLCSGLWVQGTTVYGQAVMNGGVDPAKWKSHISHRLPELEKNLWEKETQKIELADALSALSQEITSLTQQREAGLKEMEEVRIRLELGMEELSKISARRQILTEEEQAIDLDLGRIKEEKNKAQGLHEEFMVKFNLLQSQEHDDHNALDILQHEITELQSVHAQAAADLSAREEKHANFQEKLNWQKSILEHSEHELGNINQNLERHHQIWADLETQISQTKQAQTEATNLIHTSLIKRQQAAENCSAIQSKRTVLSESVRIAEAHLSEIRSRLALTQEAIQTELIKETNLQNRQDSITQKLQDQYEMTADTARLQFTTPIAADFETLDRLKKRVTNMGPINLAAPQEHAELVEKNTFMTTQHDDLIKAREDLKQVIAKINSTTREHFRETFNKVRENFRGLYSTLFQGGEADLRFTDEADILNTGIDIYCQPPGKKLLHISLLSGGEKALTAIALLFAFFQVRPSPVALLDEVDAPLDEANVLRYVDLIKTFSEKSQFLLISHNKRTMEVANTLYGVTMEELGVSKVLSARLMKATESKETTAEAQTATPTAV